MRVYAGGQYRLYPRGFLGSLAEYELPMNHPVSRVQVLAAGTETILKVEDLEGPVQSNTMIDRIYSKTINSQTALDDAAFREAIYCEALKAFGTDSLFAWIVAQKENPYFDSMQNRFVDETLGYAFRGHRRFHVSTYLTCLTIGHKNAFQKGQFMTEYWESIREMSIADFLIRWLSQDDGLTDMVQSLWIMFGNPR